MNAQDQNPKQKARLDCSSRAFECVVLWNLTTVAEQTQQEQEHVDEIEVEGQSAHH